MRPMISNTPFHKLTIPELSGGVNLRDGVSLIQDNQLTDCKNVWYKDGMLRTRPGVRFYNSNPDIVFERNILADVPLKHVYADPKNYRVIGGVTYFLVCLQSRSSLSFRYYRADGKVEEDSGLPYLEVGEIVTDELPPSDFTCNIFQHGTDIYCFCSDYYEGQAVPYYIYKISELGTDAAKAAWKVNRVGVDKDAMPYAPLVYIGGYSNMFPDKLLSELNAIEGYNLLGDMYRIKYSTAWEDVDGNGEHRYENAWYYLPQKIEKADKNQTITAEWVDISGVSHKHVVILEPNKTTGTEDTNVVPEDKLFIDVGINKQGSYVRIMDYETKEVKSFYRNEHVRNNLTITAPSPNSRENYEKVLNMTFNEWYGGGAEGLNGGIQLFMGGNKGEKSLVCWSDVNKPLYFSENCYAYVGDSSQKVTAFGKQGEALVIFKEREIYATQYTSLNTSMEAKDVINQSVVDVTANEVTFPMVQVHGFIGCDCPKTVQLCRNRLVWAHSDGKAYTLASANQYNERSVFEVSDMVGKRLKAHSTDELHGALSADWEGHYVLVVGDRLYLMDYNSYGYSNIASYTKNEDAQVKVPWWIWHMPEYTPRNNKTTQSYEKRSLDARAIASIADKLFVCVTMAAPTQTQGNHYLEEILYFKNNSKDFVPLFTATEHQGDVWYDYDDTVSQEIPTMLQTKFFDFGAPIVKKSVPKIEVAFGTNGGVPIKTTVITENSRDEGIFVIDEPEEQNKEEFSAGYFRNRLIRPINKRACRIGLRFESEGNMSVDAISLQYKSLGGLK